MRRTSLRSGDPPFPVALTWAALTGEAAETDYVEYWCEGLRLGADRRRVLRLHCALFCLELLIEGGHRFNRAEGIELDGQRVARLVVALEERLRAL